MARSQRVGRLSPDGKRVLFMEVNTTEKRLVGRVMHVLDITTGKVTKVEDVPLNGEVQGYCWSPDGKKIAFAWRMIHEGKPEEIRDKETESFLVVSDPDGKNAKTIATEKGSAQWVITIGHVDWR